MAGKTTTGILCFTGGALTGALVGLLYAPEKGRETRSWLSYQLEKSRAMLADLAEGLRHEPRAGRLVGPKPRGSASSPTPATKPSSCSATWTSSSTKSTPARAHNSMGEWVNE